MNSTPSLSRRSLLAALSVTAAGVPAWAQSNQPVRLLVGFPPGGATDAIARALAEKLKDELGTPVIVENRAGAGGQIAAQALKAAPADGHTFMVSHDHTMSVLPLVTRNPGFEPATDFIPVAGFATFANVFALSGDTPARTFQEYIALVRSGGGKDNVGIPAPASIPEFLVSLIAQKYKLDLLAAPYRGGAPMMADMMGNQIRAGIASVPDMIEFHRAGKLRIVAVIGDKRQAQVPEAPTFAELGFANLDDLAYYGVFASAHTPAPVVERFNQAMQRVMAMPDLRERFTKLGLTVGFQPQAEFATAVRKYTQTWDRIIKVSGFAPK
jgi:tripartite-type tricarboxylate transporter receptor subunit TctC